MVWCGVVWCGVVWRADLECFPLVKDLGVLVDVAVLRLLLRGGGDIHHLELHGAHRTPGHESVPLPQLKKKKQFYATHTQAALRHAKAALYRARTTLCDDARGHALALNSIARIAPPGDKGVTRSHRQDEIKMRQTWPEVYVVQRRHYYAIRR